MQANAAPDTFCAIMGSEEANQTRALDTMLSSSSVGL